MDKNVKRRWIRALKSGKYTQTQGCLKDDFGYCCLGVLTDLYLKDTGQKWKESGGEFKPGNLKGCDILSRTVAEWAGLGRRLDPKTSTTDPFGDVLTLSELNDSGYTFEEIAEIIKKDF